MNQMMIGIICCLVAINASSEELITSSDTSTPLGFASVRAGTTGGGDSDPKIATNFHELKSHLGSKSPKVIFIDGVIKTTDESGYPVEIPSNTTIIGKNRQSTIYGGIAIKNSQNVIIRNLNIHGTWPNPGPDDTIAVRNSESIWLNHLNVWDAGDGLLDITRESSYVTVSWCKFWYTDSKHSHRFCALIGSGGGDKPEDWGKLKVTYHHNWFADLVDQRMPRIVYGQAHIFNNYYTSKGNSYCVGVGSYGSALIEGNYFDGVKSPHRFMYDVYYHITAQGNAYMNTTGSRDKGMGGKRIVTGQNFEVKPLTNLPYQYTLDPADDVPRILKALTGPQ